jgi:alpha-L-rhamnosidase
MPFYPLCSSAGRPWEVCLLRILSRRVWILPLFPLSLAAASAPTGLLCDLLEHPEQTVITTRTPEFGWIYNPSARNDAQAGYRIIVASNPALAGQGSGNLWDSGMTGNSAALNIAYAGKSLQTNADYYWRVQTMDGGGQTSPFSAIQHFHTDMQLSSQPLAGLNDDSSTNIWANRYPLRFMAAEPVLVTNTAPGTWFIDFGQDAFGYATIHAHGSFAGTTIRARFGEMAADGAVTTSPPPGSNVRHRSTTLTLRDGDIVYPVRPPAYSGQTIEPPSEFGVVIPFRYLEVTNCPGSLSITDVVQERLLDEFNTNAASFTSSSPALNQIWTLCRNSMQWLTFDGIYVDGDRERKPYESDAYIHQLSSYAVDREFTLPRHTFEYLLAHPTWPTEWKFHLIFMAWADYLQTGNPDLIGKYYKTLQADGFTWAATGNGLMRGFPHFPQTTNTDIVDWPAADRDGFVISSGDYLNWTNAVNNAFYYRCLLIMGNMAGVLGITNDAANYAARAAQVYDSYNAALWNAAAQSYVDGVGAGHSSAHANFFPLDFGLVPASHQAAVVNFLHGRIAANGGMPPSVYGAQYLLEALFQSDDADTALGLLTTNGPRGWLNMLQMGSTLTTEAWNFPDKPNMDWNHPWGAAAGNLIQRFVLGVQPLTAGFSQILIQPQLGQTLTSVQGVVPTIRGPVSIQASNTPGQFRLSLNIPGNVTATVRLPALDANSTVAFVDGSAVSGTWSNHWLTVANIGAGQHAIWLGTNSVPNGSSTQR